MKTIKKYFYTSFLITFFLFGTACADDSSSKLKDIIKDSINNKAQQTDRVTVRKILQWPNSCEERFNFPTSGLTFFKQTDDDYVVQVTCTYGSYQGMSLFYKINLSKPTPISNQIKLPIYSYKNKLAAEYKTEIWGNVLTTSTVNNFNLLILYSGFGHCGSLTTYNLSGNQPKIIQLKMQPDCESKERVRDPDKWKSIKVR